RWASRRGLGHDAGRCIGRVAPHPCHTPERDHRTMYTTTDDTIPAAAGTCPPWCTDPDPHPWYPDGGGWSRMHQATIGAWAVAQMVYVNEDGTLDRMPPVVDCNLAPFDT